MRPYKSAVLLAATALALTLPGAASATAALPVANLDITRVGYNANGADRTWNRNQEYVDITNTHATDPVDVKGLVVADSWAHSHGDDNPKQCNTWTVTSLPGVTIPDTGDDAGKLLLPAGHTIRVYTGTGTPATFGTGDRFHAVFMDSKCGYHGHYLNNGGDTVWITLGEAEESFTYTFENGYYIR